MRHRSLVPVLAALLAVSLLAPAEAHAGRATKVSWTTFGFDVARSGDNPNETLLGTSNAGQLHQLWSFPLGAVTVSQALLATNVKTHGTTMDVVYIAAEDGHVHAVRASNGQEIWDQFVGIEATTDGCGGPYGVDGTMAIDRPRHRLYVSGGDDQEYALDLSTGAIAPGWPVTISTNVLHEHLWSGVTLLGSKLYVPVASYCDIGPYQGRVVLIDVTTATIRETWVVDEPTGLDGGGVWGTGGVSIDLANADVYVATGNALAFPENQPYADSVVRLDAFLNVKSYHTPNLTSGDLDFGTTPTLFQAPGCPAQLVAPNKSGNLYLYDRDSLASGPVQTLTVEKNDGRLQTVAAYSPAQNMVYVAAADATGQYTHGLLAFTVTSVCTLSLAWQQTAGVNGQKPEGSPTVANGVVYFGDGPGNTFHAYDAATGTELWNSGTAFTAQAWSAPTVVNGKLYVGDADGTLRAFGP